MQRKNSALRAALQKETERQPPVEATSDARESDKSRLEGMLMQQRSDYEDALQSAKKERDTAIQSLGDAQLELLAAATELKTLRANAHINDTMQSQLKVVENQLSTAQSAMGRMQRKNIVLRSTISKHQGAIRKIRAMCFGALPQFEFVLRGPIQSLENLDSRLVALEQCVGQVSTRSLVNKLDTSIAVCNPLLAKVLRTSGTDLAQIQQLLHEQSAKADAAILELKHTQHALTSERKLVSSLRASSINDEQKHRELKANLEASEIARGEACNKAANWQQRVTDLQVRMEDVANAFKEAQVHHGTLSARASLLENKICSEVLNRVKLVDVATNTDHLPIKSSADHVLGHENFQSSAVHNDFKQHMALISKQLEDQRVDRAKANARVDANVAAIKIEASKQLQINRQLALQLHTFQSRSADFEKFRRMARGALEQAQHQLIKLTRKLNNTQSALTQATEQKRAVATEVNALQQQLKEKEATIGILRCELVSATNNDSLEGRVSAVSVEIRTAHAVARSIALRCDEVASRLSCLESMEVSTKSIITAAAANERQISQVSIPHTTSPPQASHPSQFIVHSTQIASPILNAKLTLDANSENKARRHQKIVAKLQQLDEGSVAVLESLQHGLEHARSLNDSSTSET